MVLKPMLYVFNHFREIRSITISTNVTPERLKVKREKISVSRKSPSNSYLNDIKIL